MTADIGRTCARDACIGNICVLNTWIGNTGIWGTCTGGIEPVALAGLKIILAGLEVNNCNLIFSMRLIFAFTNGVSHQGIGESYLNSRNIHGFNIRYIFLLL